MDIKKFARRTLAVLGLAGAVSIPAHATFLDFTVDERGVPGVPTVLQTFLKEFSADKLTGTYSEIFTVTGPASFATSAYASFNQFSSDEGFTPITGVASGFAYSLYATFKATGDIINGGQNFRGETGVIELYLDSFLSNIAGGGKTVLTLPSNGTGSVGRTNTADDYLIASTKTFLYGEGNNRPGGLGGANGDFSLTFTNFLLEEAGKNYFVAPDPFHMNVTVDGNFGNFPLPGLDGSARITGAANAFFVVPEPSMIALLGIGLLGFSLSKRRRN